jgi:beta-phosphoglucomutase
MTRDFTLDSHSDGARTATTGAGIARLNEVASADAATDADEAWHLRRQGDDAEVRTGEASLFALANGSLGVRGGGEETADGCGGCYLAGVYERHPIEFHERLPGFVRGTDIRVPVADGTGIALMFGETHGIDTNEDLERTLDLRTGRLLRSRVVRTPLGARLRIESERVVAHDRDVLAIRLRITSIDYDGPITLHSRLRSGAHAATQGDDPRIGSAGSRGLHTIVCTADSTAATLVQSTLHSDIAIACVQMHRVDQIHRVDQMHHVDDGEIAFLRADIGDDRATQQFIAQLRPGASVTLQKFVAYAHADGGHERGGQEHETDALRAMATGIAQQAAHAGYAAIAAARAAELNAFWRDVDLAVEGDLNTQLALRFNLFHLLQSTSRQAAHGTAAKGLTGEGYEGHCFWDTEVFVLPVMVFTAPAIARAMLMFRYRTLDAARANARELNHPTGALYPWRTIAGGECSAHYPSGSAAYHINADIAYAIGLYLDASEDIGFMLEAGAEMLFETARIWPQAGHFDPLRDGAFGIHGVTGPDEYTALIDNNFYTNRMAQRHLQRAVAVWDRLGNTHPAERAALAARLQLGEDEIALWRRAADTMQLRIDAQLGIYAQDDTFLHKPRWRFSVRGRAAHRDERALLLDQHPMTLYRHQVCKQADVVMALVLAGDGLDADTKRRSFDYYEAITTHDSTLSPAIHGILACELGLHESSRAFFYEALRVDLDDLHGNTDHGVHMAAMAGSWLGVVWGFAGLRVVDGELHLAPTLPIGWQGYRVGLQWRGCTFTIAVSASGVEYRLRSGEHLRIHHRDRVLELRADAPLREAFDPRFDVSTGDSAATLTAKKVAFPRACRALIFDLDGVLTDTAHLHYRAWKRLADELGIAFDERINRRLKGVDRMGSLEILLEGAARGYSDDEKAALAERKNGYYRDAIADFRPQHVFPGVREVLHAAKAAGLRIALASASRNAPALLQRLGIADAFDAIADPAQSRPKPHPDLFLAAAAALGVEPQTCIGIEDAASGIAAIKAAGMAAVGIGDAEELAQADCVLATIAQFALQNFVSLR